jgi:putative membrane protein
MQGIHFDGPRLGEAEVQEKLVPLLVVALILGLVTSFVKPVLKVLSFPLIILTLGLFLLVINALMLMLTSWLADRFDIGFTVNGFWTAVGGAIVITLVTWVADGLLGEERMA